jgi:hypothetical protein
MCGTSRRWPADVTPLDISSEYRRVYTYADGAEFVIQDPALLFVLANGSHRVVDKHGYTHRPTPGFVGISWGVHDFKPYFVA